ncbi:hypothetical protein FT662_05486 [Candidozyma haemuli var. vulneris]|nr:hypothetical protein FT662_05486 [[Candida] haemuloni var. vulneris]
MFGKNILPLLKPPYIRSYSTRMVDFTGKYCLAPMVRSGELPTRLMALKHGADLVWSPEIVDKKLRNCARVVNKELGTIDYVESRLLKVLEEKPGQSVPVVFRTDRAKEAGRLILQIGSADPEIAVEAAEKVIQDVDGVDLNCGCPKPFSTHSGMGAALLSTPELLTSILSNLVEKVGKPNDKPISAKIRLLDQNDPAPTLELVEKICKTGISNLTVHCRTRSMRNRDTPIRDFVKQIYEVVSKFGVTLVINGGFQCRKEIENFQKSIDNFNVGGMIAEAAESNPTVFAPVPLPWKAVTTEFLDICMEYNNFPSNTKYILLNQIPGKSPVYKDICKVKTNEDFLKAIQNTPEKGDLVFVRTMQKAVAMDSESFMSQFETKRKVSPEPEIVEKRAKIEAVAG